MIIQGNVRAHVRVIPLASIGSQHQQKRLDMMGLPLAALGFAQSPKQSVGESMYQENRIKMLTKSKPELAKHLLQTAQAEVDAGWQLYWQLYKYLAARKI